MMKNENNEEDKSSLTNAQKTNENHNNDVVDKPTFATLSTNENSVPMDDDDGDDGDGDKRRHTNNESEQEPVDRDHHNNSFRQSHSNENKLINDSVYITIKPSEDYAPNIADQADPHQQQKKEAFTSLPNDQEGNSKNVVAPKMNDLDGTELLKNPELKHSTEIDGPSGHGNAHGSEKKGVKIVVPASPMNESGKSNADQCTMVGPAQNPQDTKKETVDTSRSTTTALNQQLMYARIRAPWDSPTIVEQPAVVEPERNPVQRAESNIDNHAPGAYAIPPPGRPSGHFKKYGSEKNSVMSIPASPTYVNETSSARLIKMVSAANKPQDANREAVEKQKSTTEKHQLMHAPIRGPWDSTISIDSPALIEHAQKQQLMYAPLQGPWDFPTSVTPPGLIEQENPAQRATSNVQSRAHVQQDDHAPGAYAIPQRGQPIGTSLPIPGSHDDSSLWSHVLNENDAREHDADDFVGPPDIEDQGATFAHTSGAGDSPQVEARLVEEEGIQNQIEIVRAIPNKKWHQRPFLWGMVAFGVCILIGLVTGIVVATRPDSSDSITKDSTVPPSATQPSTKNPPTVQPSTMEPATSQPSAMKPTVSLNESLAVACDFVGYPKASGYTLSDCLLTLEVNLPSDHSVHGTTIPTEIGVLTQLTSFTIDSVNDVNGVTYTGSIPSDIGRLTNLKSLTIKDQLFLQNTLPSSMINLKQLTSLSLTGIELKGTIPSWIGGMTRLTSMSLADNYFNGRITSAITELTRLRTLKISRNQLTGSLPSDIVGLTQLEALDVSVNSLSGTIPFSIGNLTKLMHLDLSGGGDGASSGFTGTIPSSIGDLIQLTYLRMSMNSLNGTILSTIGNLIELTSLYLYGNSLNGTIPSSIEKLIQLSTLDMSENSLTGTIPASIENLIHLRDMGMAWNSLTGTIPSSIGNLIKLTALSLVDNSLTGTIPPSIGNLIQLAYLDMSDSSFRGKIPSSLGNLTNLSYFALSHNQLTGMIPTSLQEISGPLDMYLYNNSLTGSFPQSICELVLNLTVVIDCGVLNCSCCTDWNTWEACSIII